MITGDEIQITARFLNQPASVTLSQFIFAQPDFLAEPELRLSTSCYIFSTRMLLEPEGLASFVADLDTLIQTNRGVATLRSYTEDQELRFLATGRASGEIVIEGQLQKLLSYADEEVYLNLPPVNNIRSGMVFQFGGLETDQSYLQSALTSLRRLLS